MPKPPDPMTVLKAVGIAVVVVVVAIATVMTQPLAA
jgi:hypothetical protein